MPSLLMSRTGFGSANMGLNDRSQFSYALAACDILPRGRGARPVQVSGTTTQVTTSHIRTEEYTVCDCSGVRRREHSLSELSNRDAARISQGGREVHKYNRTILNCSHFIARRYFLIRFHLSGVYTLANYHSNMSSPMHHLLFWLDVTLYHPTM